MRKKPWARPELESCDFFVVNPKEYKGKWKEFFGNDQPIYLELGCGKGTFMAVHGSENPNINYIAIDIKDEVLGLAKRNIEKAFEEKGRDKVENVKLMAQEINLINEILGEDVAIIAYSLMRWFGSQNIFNIIREKWRFNFQDSCLERK